MTDVDALVAFLRARLDERSDPEAPEPHLSTCAAVRWGFAERDCDCGEPDRVLAEVDAKRRIIDHIEDQWDAAYGEPGRFLPPEWVAVLQLLALPYADHPEFRQEWRP
ncbi:DUF6221 family protein [Amycolatopsis sp. NPDC006131]|uniref:DUF6221 family protein n=1 Tax=Amycolatopsis sp. NPDC006131 TaxID=3156731 RepID=UPI0033BF17D9